MARKTKPTPARGKSKHITPQHAAKKAHARIRAKKLAAPKLANEPGPVTVTDPESDTSWYGGVM